jgi:hypothetical protein
MFAIEVIDSDPSPVRGGAYLGRICLGDFRENFDLASGYWSPGDYERSWLRCLREMINGADIVAFMSWMYQPGTDRPFRAWIGYRDGSAVRFQDVLLLPGIADLRFSGDHVLLNPPARKTKSEDGDPISEWSATLDDMTTFLSGNPA